MIFQPATILTIALQNNADSAVGWVLFLVGLIVAGAFLVYFRRVNQADLAAMVQFEQRYPAAAAMPAGFTLAKEAPAAQDTHAAHDDHATADTPETAVTDNLTRIEGIGPKIAETLQAAGISSFSQLAASDPADLQKILDEAEGSFQLADPLTWPEQAKLAAAADWDGLKALQSKLDGGRR